MNLRQVFGMQLELEALQSVVEGGLSKCSKAVKVWSAWYWKHLWAAVISGKAWKFSFEVEELPSEWAFCVLFDQDSILHCWFFGFLFFVFCSLPGEQGNGWWDNSRWFGAFNVISKEADLGEFVDLSWPDEHF